MKSISNIIAVLGLLAIASIAVIIGYNIIVGYVSSSLKPRYDISISHAKLVYITDNEIIDGTPYTTFKLEIGVSNPGNPTVLGVCIVSAAPSGTSHEYTPTTFTGKLSCPEIQVDTGYNVYSVIVRIRNSELDKVGCWYEKKTCPIRYDWHVIVFDSEGTPVAIVKPVYIIP